MNQALDDDQGPVFPRRSYQREDLGRSRAVRASYRSDEEGPSSRDVASETIVMAELVVVRRWPLAEARPRLRQASLAGGNCSASLSQVDLVERGA